MLAEDLLCRPSSGFVRPLYGLVEWGKELSNPVVTFSWFCIVDFETKFSPGNDKDVINAIRVRIYENGDGERGDAS